MAHIFSKHAILSGHIDFYCLVCENRFLTVEDTIKHIITDFHQQQLGKTIYESKDDGIKKIKLWYFCEFCSIVLKTKAKVRLHIVETLHVANKVDQFIKRYGNVLIAFDDVHIDNDAWEGLCDSTCILCNNEYEDVSEHLKDPIHHINFMQSNIEFKNKNIFRMVDETSFHCITCNSQEALPVNTHFDASQHKDVYLKCQMLAAKLIEDQNNGEKLSPTENEVQQKIDIPELASKEKAIPLDIQTDLLKMQNEEVEMYFPIPLPEPENTNESIMIHKKSDHPEEIVNNTVETRVYTIKNTVYNIKEEEELICEVLKADNYITKNDKESKWCILCDWVMNSSDIYGHMTSVHHTNILKLHKMRIQNSNNHKNKNNTSVEQNKSLKPSNIDTANENFQEKFDKIVNEVPQQDSASTKPQHKVNNADEPDKPNNNSSIVDSLKRFQDNHININLANMTVFCRLCSTKVDFDYISIEEHINLHEKKVNKSVPKENSKQIDDEFCHTLLTEDDLALMISKQFQSDDISINFETKQVTCKKCSISLAFDYKTVKSHILTEHLGNHKDSQKSKHESSSLLNLTPQIDEEENYANKHNFKHTPDQNLVFCEICKTQVIFVLKDMIDHIHSNSHKAQVEANKTKIETIPLNLFIQTLVTVENSIFKDHIINNEFCVNVLSFILLTSIPEVNMFKCLCCDVYLREDEWLSHSKSKDHLDVLTNMKLVINIKDEFIRQLPSSLFHCGFCNILVNCWQEVITHLSTVSHKQCKISAKVRLQSYSSSIADYEGKVSNESRFIYEIMLK
ncbi:uncharacterized protein LOC111002872 [Pieris rapae]|uniref:uncharacterized protein LOC111002872 n=1 Tax=Pieris rapae TaxID=64459 RepID=UPI001E27BA4E|nr:uncharacterized protein LOC111002872 [Pieris rapae]XP_022128830.2 uncharacterized protein LOC111002872 [Pieris rapae]XP_022128831.2 uncharacterized protein LOC111002872 [Pieris rapae]XP_022128832.2 uncharacterized protein LOC111002872 [Pieris rapae]XP_045488954.1 uncharacterized protein LOC111002872 [Pieris rapae]